MPTYSKYSPVGGGGGGITSINGDTTAAQLIVGGTGISVATALGTTTITNTSPAPATGNLTETISSILTITGGTGAVVGSGTTIQVLQAGAAQDGFLSSTDWNTFNNKQPAGTYVTSVTGSAPIASSGGTTPAISITQSGVATDGYLSSTDWNTFNNKATYPAFSDDQVLYSTTTGAEWRIVGTGSTTAAYPTDTVILGRTKPAALTGATNLLVGTGAGTALTSGADNVLIGKNTGLGLTNQNRFIAIGSGALDSLTGTSDPGQIAIGYDALTAVVNPTAGGLGSGAGSHVAIGYRAGVNMTGGRASVYIGDSAGGGCTTGGQNVMVGPFAGSANANQSIFIGYCAGRGASGNYNTVIGGTLNAFVLGSGSSNVGLGGFVFTTTLSTPGGAQLTSGSNNTFLGTGSTALASTQSNSIALGYQCVTGANEFSVGSSNAQINTMLLGRGGASQTVANAVKIQTMRSSGTDTDMSAGTLTLAGAQGTGTGPGGDVIIATAPAGASGSTLNNHVDRLKVTAAGETQFLGSTSGYVGVSSPAAPTSYSLVLPSAQGGAGTTLENDGSGNLSWVSGGLPSQAGNDEKVLATNGTNTSWQYAGLGSGSFASGTVILGRPKPTSLTGADNIIIGSSAGNSLSNQTKHIAIGTSALSTFNVAVANEPNQCVAIGYEALKVINTASQNWGMVAMGYRAGYNATSGDGAVLIGFSAGNNGTSFGRCVYIGRQAGGGGSVNTGVGMASLRACTGSENTALGDSSLSNVSTGTHNIGIGVNAGNSPTGGVTITTGSSNIIIGHQAGVLTASTSSAIALGRLSVAGANEFSIGSASYQINTMLLGRGGASQTAANAVKIQTMRASGTDTSMTVGTLTLAGAQGTGTGAGGDVIIATAPAGASGSSLNSHVDRLKVTASGETQLLGSTSGYVGLSSPAAPTSYSLVLPSAQGAASSVLTNDGSGNLSWNVPASPTRNKIINGAMEIDQRNSGSSVTLTSGGIYTVDRFEGFEDTDGVMTAQQTADAPPGFLNSLICTTTTADASIGTAQYCIVSQKIEGKNVIDLAWGSASAQTVTLSFWVKSTLTGTFSGSLLNSAQDRSYPFEYSISSANTWEQKTITISGDTTGTWLTTTGIGVQVVWSLGIGFDYWGTANTWNAAGAFGTVSTAVIGTLNATWQLTGVQLEVGSAATSFDWTNYQQELAMCQRYYYRFTPTAATQRYGNGFFQSTTSFRSLINFPVPMRIAPTALEQSGTAGDYSVVGGSTFVCTSVPTFSVASLYNCDVSFTGSGFSAGEGGLSRAVNTSAYLGWSAEL
jgi:hypothetical protein